MKTVFNLLISTLLSFNSFGQNNSSFGQNIYWFGQDIYSLSPRDFKTQFSDSVLRPIIFCQNKKGEKVWLHHSDKSIITFSIEEERKKSLILNSVKLKDGVVQGLKFSTFWGKTKKLETVDFNKIIKIIIEPGVGGYATPYFNIDSSLALLKTKNDSLIQLYNNGTEFQIHYLNLGLEQKDTIKLIENALYNLQFNDGNKTEFGIVTKITSDSIYITNYLNSAMAERRDKEFEIYKYDISSIKKIYLLKPGYRSYNSIDLNEFKLTVIGTKRDPKNCPYWYSMDQGSGAIHLYRIWQTEMGFSGITVIDGRAIWYEN